MKSNNLPFSVTLKDLAVLRASDVDLSTVLEAQEPSSNTESLERSREFIKEARAALKIANSESVEKQGARIEERKSSEIEKEDVIPRKRPALEGQATSSLGTQYWAVQWRNPQSRKHKTWEGDGLLQVEGGLCTLFDSDGKFMGRGKHEQALAPQDELHIGGKDISIDCALNAATFQATVGNRPNFNPTQVPSTSSASLKLGASSGLQKGYRRPFKALQPSSNGKITGQQNLSAKPPTSDRQYPPSKTHVHVTDLFEDEVEPVGGKYEMLKGPKVDESIETLWSVNWRKSSTKKNKTWDGDGVVHQKGSLVRFMSDDMKKLIGTKTWDVVLALGSKLWIGDKEIEVDAKLPLSRLNSIVNTDIIDLEDSENIPPPPPTVPIARKFTAPAVVKKVERQEDVIRKPKPLQALHDPTTPGAIVMKSPSTTHQQRFNPKQRPIVPVVRLRGVIHELAYCNPPIGLVVCDEGHRLKSSSSKTSKMFQALRTPKRVILSGTPIQNDLGEFHAMADFCNPGVLDDYSNFKRTFEVPIIASRMPDCSSKSLQKGRDKAEQLQTLAKSFVLRREATILANYLPPKYEYVVFVSPTQIQLQMITHLLNPENLYRLTDSTAKSLALIQTLSKLCNSPYLLKGRASVSDDIIAEVVRMVPAQARAEDITLSGKLSALGGILKELRATTDEKCIIVSHYTSTLDIIEAFCNKQRYTLFRLDGRTPQAQRQEFVDKFNKSPQSERYLFLLSAKAGGVGLNLIGASRLILVDGDWNPSHDLQAMARIHRDGQKRPVYIYRLLTAGTIDEKIFQRQITKIGLSDAMMGTSTSSSKSKTDSFTSKELRDLFSIHPHAICHTHELLACACSTLAGSAIEDDGHLAVNPVRNAVSLIQDRLLRSLVHTPRGGESKSLDDEFFWDVDEKGPSEEEETPVRDVPGGTMTFIFERVSKTGL
ncbi:helicase [Serendipita sp. 405]|nr:helicase [Serendipita sp. 405]